MIILRLLIRIPFLLWIAIGAGLAYMDYQDWTTNVLTPQMQSIEQKQVQLAAKRQDIARAEDFQKRREEKLAELQSLNQQLEATKSQLPRTSSVPELLRSMADIASTTGLSLSRFKPMVERRTQFLVETPIEVSITGTYVQIMSFLDALANLTRVVATEKLVFESPQFRSGVSVLTAAVTLVTYHLEDTGDNAPANPPGR